MHDLSKIQLKHILPHAAPMILIDAVKDYASDYIHTTLLVRNDAPFCSGGRVPAYVAIEYMAQSIAAWHSLNSEQNYMHAKIGFLLGSRNMQLETDFFYVGDQLDISCNAVFSHEGMAAFDCYLEHNGARMVQATLNVFQPEDVTQFLEVPA